MPAALDRLGVGLFTMQSTAAAPVNPVAAYRAFARDAVLAEELGFHSVWTAEHRLWYDGWCPALVHAQALAAARTSRIRFGNAMLLLTQHDPAALARSVATLDRLSGGRVDLGVALGHRDPEFDALGLRRDRRGALMDRALDVLAETWAGDAPCVQEPGPPIWVGGMAPAAIERAALRGHGLMLPQTLRPDELRPIVDDFRARSVRPARVGTLRDVWIEPDPRRASEMRRRIAEHYLEEAGAWWILKGEVGFSQPEQLERQASRIASTAVVGSAAQVAEALGETYAAGADFVAARLSYGYVEPAILHDQMHRLAGEVAPLLDSVAA